MTDTYLIYQFKKQSGLACKSFKVEAAYTTKT